LILSFPLASREDELEDEDDFDPLALTATATAGFGTSTFAATAGFGTLTLSLPSASLEELDDEEEDDLDPFFPNPNPIDGVPICGFLISRSGFFTERSTSGLEICGFGTSTLAPNPNDGFLILSFPSASRDDELEEEDDLDPFPPTLIPTATAGFGTSTLAATAGLGTLTLIFPSASLEEDELEDEDLDHFFPNPNDGFLIERSTSGFEICGFGTSTLAPNPNDGFLTLSLPSAS